MGTEVENVKKIDTAKLKFMLGIGEAGLTMWKGRQLKEVRQKLALLRAELIRRDAL